MHQSTAPPPLPERIGQNIRDICDSLGLSEYVANCATQLLHHSQVRCAVHDAFVTAALFMACLLVCEPRHARQVAQLTGVGDDHLSLAVFVLERNLRRHQVDPQLLSYVPAETYIARFGLALRLSHDTTTLAETIARKQQSTTLVGVPPRVVAATAVFAAVRKHKIPLTASHIASRLAVDRGALVSAYRKVHLVSAASQNQSQ